MSGQVANSTKPESTQAAVERLYHESLVQFLSRSVASSATRASFEGIEEVISEHVTRAVKNMDEATLRASLISALCLLAMDQHERYAKRFFKRAKAS